MAKEGDEPMRIAGQKEVLFSMLQAMCLPTSRVRPMKAKALRDSVDGLCL